MSDLKTLIKHTPPTMRGRALKYGGIWVAVFALTIAVLWVASGKAFATCSPGGGDPTCPTGSAFKAKWDQGFFTHGNGIPVNKVFGAPDKTANLFQSKYISYYANHPGKQDAMYAHAEFLNGNTKLARRAMKWLPHKAGRRDQCMSPLSSGCMAVLEWENSIDNTDCILWHTFPNVGLKASCDRAREPGPDQSFLSWSDVSNGIKLIGCTVASGYALFLVVTGGDKGPLGVAAATGGSLSCAVDAWDALN